MNIYTKEFFHRGLMFGGFGPIIVGIIFYCVSAAEGGISLSAPEALVAILSSYLLAFVHAGASVLNQIEHWPIMKSLFFHFLLLYVSYLSCYLINAWIPFDGKVVGIFTAIFVAVYFVVWAIVYLSVRNLGKRMTLKVD